MSRGILVGAATAIALALVGCGGSTSMKQAQTGPTGSTVTIPTGSTVSEAAAQAAADQFGGVRLVYRAVGPLGSSASTSDVQRSVTIISDRLRALRLRSPFVGSAGARITLVLPGVRPDTNAASAVGQVDQLYFYDWEPNVIGPRGQPDPQNVAVTGGQTAGQPSIGVPLYRAVSIASKRPSIVRANDTTNGTWYLVNDATRTVLRGPADTRSSLVTGVRRPPGARVVEIHPGTVIVQAETPNNAPDANLNSYYVLNDNPVLSSADITNPAQTFDNGPNGTGQPIVTFGFSSAGGKAFQNVTREIARRGQKVSLPGQNNFQHFAMVLDGRVITVPYIDFTANPDGVDPSNGAQIQGGFTVDSAKQLVDLLRAGTLPTKLVLESQTGLGPDSNG